MGDEPSAAAGWYPVRTRAGAESKVLVGIEAARMEAFLPVARTRMNYRGNHRQPCAVIWRPVFMGCVFVALDPSRDFPALRAIDGWMASRRRLPMPSSRRSDLPSGAVCSI
jgi:hypothetical protein